MDMLANRVRKNARHLGKWAKREGVTCWRVYDRDIPEIPLTIDTYEGALVINDYRAFDRREPSAGGGDPDGFAGGAGSRAPRGIDRREPSAGVGDPDGFAGGAGSRAPRGIDRREPSAGGGDPEGFAGGAGGRAPRGIARDDAGAWLDAAVDAVRGVLAPSDVFVKQRERLAHRGAGQQYERQADRGAWRTVREAGHKFRVNLSDYVDTGLFLDHRITRAKVAAEPARTMLNLFAYTGAFSVYAAAAGMQTTTVDLSNTYLEWAAENLALNRLTGEFVHADVREFLAGARRTGRRWELVVVDPPTFSNSKRMDYTWDLQRDHAALLDDVFAVCSGVVWFSTNRRRFTLEVSDPSLAVSDLTRATIPPDFRDSRIHHAYRITRRG